MRSRRFLHGLVAVTTVLLVALVVLTLRQRRTAPLPVLGEVPEFSLTEASGNPLRRADLAGRVWVAGFIFTHCASTCPIMSRRMSELQAQLGSREGLMLVSFSVDPQRDTPAVLTEYARQYGADRQRWLFVTGDKAQIRRLARDGFHLAAEDGTPEDDEPILHSTHLVLVDRHGRIRGYYDGMDAAALGRLLHDARVLGKESA